MEIQSHSSEEWLSANASGSERTSKQILSDRSDQLYQGKTSTFFNFGFKQNFGFSWCLIITCVGLEVLDGGFYDHVQSFLISLCQMELETSQSIQDTFQCLLGTSSGVSHTHLSIHRCGKTLEPQQPNVEQVIWSATGGLLDQIPAQAFYTELEKEKFTCSVAL